MKNCKKLIAGMVLSLLTVLNTAGAFSVGASALEKTQPKGSEPVIQKSESPTRTIMLFLVGANLESENGLATADLIECMNAEYDENVNIIAVTGGTTEWHTQAEYLDGAEAIDPMLNQIWKVEGKKEGEEHGKMTLIEPEGLPGFEDALMGQPAALTGFIDYCYDNYKSDYYDIVLWDHGGGPALGFGYDDRFEGDINLDMAELIKSFDDSKLINDGQKFEIIDFDACLMSSVEIVTALYDFADNLVLSSDIENGTGQYYTLVLEVLRKNPSMSGFELGKNIVDCFITFDNYKYGDSTTSTLSVINTDNYKKRLADKLKKFDDILISEATSAGNNGELNFYDELQSLESIIEFDNRNENYSLFDLGGLAGTFSTPNVEADNVTEEEYLLRENSYTAVVKDILSVLNDQDGSGDDVIYSGHSKNYIRKYSNPIYSVRGLDGELIENDEEGYVNVSPTGLSLYFGYTEGYTSLGYTTDYVKAMSDAISASEDPDTKIRLSKRLNAVGYYKLISIIGCAVSTMKTDGIEKIDLETVKTYLSTQSTWKNVEWLLAQLEDTGGFGSVDEGYEYISALIAQQQKDIAAPGDISAKKIKIGDKLSTYYHVDFNNCSVKPFQAISSGISMHLKDPFTSDFQNIVDSFYGEHMNLKELYPSGVWVKMYLNKGGFDVSGRINSFNDSTIQIYRNCFTNDSYSCILQEQLPYSLAITDANGNNYIANVKFLDDTYSIGYIPIIIKVDGVYKQANIKFAFNEASNEFKITSLSVNDSMGIGDNLNEFISDEWEGASFATVSYETDCYEYKQAVPISSFIKIDNTKEFWGLSLCAADYSEISDNYFDIDYHYVDIYGVTHHLDDVLDKANEEAKLGNVVYYIQDAAITVGEAFYDGTEQKPEVVVTFGEKVLTEGVDYKLFYDGSIERGNAQIMVTGIGDYFGVRTVDYTITCPHSFELRRSIAATCTKKGKAEYKCSICGEKKIEDIEPLGHEWDEWIVTRKPTSTRQGKKIRVCLHCGKIQTEAIPVEKTDISKAEFRISNKKLYYTGSTVTPELKVAYRNKLLTEGKHYELTFENAVEPGKATFKINGIGQFTGTLTGEYIIIPAKVKINSAVSDTAGTIDVSWVNDGTADGYEILLYTSKSNGFVRSTETFSAAGSDSSIKITGLDAGKRCNVFVRAYKMVDGKPVYSKYGSSQSVTVIKG